MGREYNKKGLALPFIFWMFEYLTSQFAIVRRNYMQIIFFPSDCDLAESNKGCFIPRVVAAWEMQGIQSKNLVLNKCSKILATKSLQVVKFLMEQFMHVPPGDGGAGQKPISSLSMNPPLS